jgi:hypothetical protein
VAYNIQMLHVIKHQQVKRLSLIFAFSFVLASCGYDGGYRYPCQDPENWESEECNPPVCKVNGACTEDLLGFNPTLESLVNPELNELLPTEETVAP